MTAVNLDLFGLPDVVEPRDLCPECRGGGGDCPMCEGSGFLRPVEEVDDTPLAVLELDEPEVVAPGAHVERALAAEVATEDDEPPAISTALLAQEALFDLAPLTEAHPLADVRKEWDSYEPTTPAARLKLWESITVKSMRLAYDYKEFTIIVARLNRAIKELGVKNATEALPKLLDCWERRHAT